MVYTRAVEAIREHTAGPRRVRTIGFYGLLCQLANEQRAIGQQRRVRYSYDLLATRGGVSKGSVAKMLACLEQAGVLQRETQADPERGGSISIAHLLIHEHSFIAVTVPMADRLAAPRGGGPSSAARSRTDHRAARVLRAAASGRDVDPGAGHSLADRRALRAARRARRRLPPHPRKRPVCSPLNVVERATAVGTCRASTPSTKRHSARAVNRKPPGRQNGTGRAAGRNGQGGESELAGRQNGTGRAAGQNWQGGNAATGMADSPPSSARAGDGEPEEQRENFQGGQPEPVEDEGVPWGYGTSEWVIEAFIDAWKPALGSSPAVRYGRDTRRWHEAADNSSSASNLSASRPGFSADGRRPIHRRKGHHPPRLRSDRRRADRETLRLRGKRRPAWNN